jgi:hypothetical protein
MSRYVLAAGWQDQDPWPSGAHWELGWDDERVTFWARLFEDYGPAEPEDELLPSDYEPISSHGDRPGELLDIDQLTTLMEEVQRGEGRRLGRGPDGQIWCQAARVVAGEPSGSPSSRLPAARSVF